jgi:hypothetical protein
VLADHVGPMEDLHDGPVLHLPWTQDSLDPELRGESDDHMTQQSS